MKVTQNPASPVEPSVLAQAIIDISASMKKLTASGLNRKAVIILTHHNCKASGRPPTKVGMRDIDAVFKSVESLAKTYAHKL